MSNEQIRISPEQAQKISQMLQNDGVSKSEIAQILNGNYETYNTEFDFETLFGGLKKHGDILFEFYD